MKIKVQQIISERLVVLTSSNTFSTDEVQWLEKEIKIKFPGYKTVLLECIDAHFGNASIKKVEEIHNKVHKFLDIPI